MKPKNIYIVVLVTYDYHRLQKNLAAAYTLAAARRIAEQHLDKWTTKVIESGEESSAMDGGEKDHIWIQKKPVSQNHETQNPRLVRPADRVTDKRQHCRLKLAALKRNQMTNLTDARFV
jgi:hypothetical protein